MQKVGMCFKCCRPATNTCPMCHKMVCNMCIDHESGMCRQCKRAAKGEAPPPDSKMM